MTEKKDNKNSKIMKDKVGVIMGLANDKSLAWGIAEQLFMHDASIILTYQGEMLKKRVNPLAQKINSPAIFECDVSSEESVIKTFDKISIDTHPNDILNFISNYNKTE